MRQVCEQLHWLFNSLPRQRFPFDTYQIPENGIYILFEDGERAHGVDRIVPVGTHTGANRLPSRLEEHFIRENKEHSVFRKNIGRALLNQANDPFLRQWEWDLTTRESRQRLGPVLVTERQRVVEKQVSDYIQRHISFVVFRVAHKDKRLSLEKKLISTISLCPECKPSTNWLGLYSPERKVRESGLWLVNGLYG